MTSTLNCSKYSLGFKTAVSLWTVGMLASSLSFADGLKVGIASQSAVKSEAVNAVFRSLFPGRKITVSTFAAPSGVAEQPVGKSAGERGALNRLKSAKWTALNANLHYDYWVSIESFVTPQADDSRFWEDQAVVVVEKEGHEAEVELSKAVSFSSSLADVARAQTEVTDSLSESGFATTIGKVIQGVFAQRGEVVAADDWQGNPSFGGISRSRLLQPAIARAVLKSEIDTIVDFPKRGVVFKDMIPLLGNPELFSSVIRSLARQYQGLEIDAVAGLEARGFLLGLPLAQQMKLPFFPVRKKGKLPRPTHSVEYATEYSRDQIEISTASLVGKTVLIVDDLLATGGTLKAAEDLMKQAGAKKVYSVCLIELLDLEGKKKLSSTFSSILKY